MKYVKSGAILESIQLGVQPSTILRASCRLDGLRVMQMLHHIMFFHEIRRNNKSCECHHETWDNLHVGNENSSASSFFDAAQLMNAIISEFLQVCVTNGP